MKCLLIGNDKKWWDVIDTPKEDFKEVLNADAVEYAAIEVRLHGKKRRFGCAYDVSGRAKCLPFSVILRKERFIKKLPAKYLGYINGPVIIYLNGGLTDEDADWISTHIIPYDGNPTLIVDGAKEDDDYGEDEP